MKTRMKVLGLLAMLALAIYFLVVPAEPGIGLVYNSDVSVTQTNSAVTFSDNGSGGISQMFNAKYVLVRSLAASANTCYLDLKDTTATTSDTALEPGASLRFVFPPSSQASSASGVIDGWPGLGAICTTAETATFRVTAMR